MRSIVVENDYVGNHHREPATFLAGQQRSSQPGRSRCCFRLQKTSVATAVLVCIICLSLGCAAPTEPAQIAFPALNELLTKATGETPEAWQHVDELLYWRPGLAHIWWRTPASLLVLEVRGEDESLHSTGIYVFSGKDNRLLKLIPQDGCGGPYLPVVHRLEDDALLVISYVSTPNSYTDSRRAAFSYPLEMEVQVHKVTANECTLVFKETFIAGSETPQGRQLSDVFYLPYSDLRFRTLLLKTEATFDQETGDVTLKTLQTYIWNNDKNTFLTAEEWPEEDESSQ